MIDASNYGIEIRRTTIDGELYFEATVSELPDVRAFGSNFQEAYESAISAITALEQLAREKGRDFPLPRMRDEEASGRVTLRLPKSLHARVIRAASDDGVSLNTFLCSAIAMSLTPFSRGGIDTPRELHRSDLLNVTTSVGSGAGHTFSHLGETSALSTIFNNFVRRLEPEESAVEFSPMHLIIDLSKEREALWSNIATNFPESQLPVRKRPAIYRHRRTAVKSHD